jgi:hypothetical protein
MTQHTELTQAIKDTMSTLQSKECGDNVDVTSIQTAIKTLQQNERAALSKAEQVT